MGSRLEQKHQELVEFTKDCRLDMHEPDEQGISARVVGDHLDNAMGDEVDAKAIRGGFQEYVVILQNAKRETLEVNLATLIAMARAAQAEELAMASMYVRVVSV